jgi:4-amino-4-deoxy-L-arabinose transferase-like glycosyltransferase
VKVIVQYLQRESLWPLLVAVIAAAILLPGLDQAGFWEPYEIRVADRAHERLGQPAEPPAAPAEPTEPAAPDKAEKPAAPAAQPAGPPGPPLHAWSMAQGMRLVGGDKELGARLPLALLGILAVLATFFLGRRLGSPRAGLLSALTLLAFPLTVFQSRQLMSQIGLAAGSALTVLGLVGLAWPARGADGRHAPWRYAVDAALVLAGAAVSYLSAAALMGIVVPFGAVGLACVAGLAAAGEPDRRPGVPRAPVVAGLVLLGLGLGVLVMAWAGVLSLGRAAQLGLGVGPAALGAILFAGGMMSARAKIASDPAVRRQRAHLVTVAALGLGVAGLALIWVLAAVFDLRDPIPGERALLGFSVVPTNDYVAALGGVWRQGDDARATFDVLFEQIAYGAFPWSALAPIALVHLALGLRRGRSAWAGLVPLAWAALAWIVAAVMARKVGPVQYPALPALGLGLGLWLDAVLAARRQADAAGDTDADAGRDFGVPLRLPLVALFAALAALVLGKDIAGFPDRVTNLNALEVIEYPKEMTLLGIDIKIFWLVFGVLFALALGGGLWLWEQSRPRGRERRPWHLLGRHGVTAAVAVGLAFALFLAHGWLPVLSHKLSSKELYAAYDDVRDEGEPLGVLGNPGTGLTYYAGDGYETLRNRDGLIELLRRPARVFALAPASELCALHRSIKGTLDYYVLDNSHAKFLLLSNQLEPGEDDRNPLAQAIVREPPANIRQPMRVNFDDRVELIGVDMPASVERGETFRMTLYFRVLRPLSTAWKLFLHFDGGSMRFQGDHDPIEGRCATTYWQPGDYIIDSVEVEAGNVTYAKTAYTVYVGFFRGSHGSWTNMTVKSAEDGAGKPVAVDPNHRVNIGSLRVD